MGVRDRPASPGRMVWAMMAWPFGPFSRRNLAEAKAIRSCSGKNLAKKTRFYPPAMQVLLSRSEGETRRLVGESLRKSRRVENAG
jgi:hypothetical protein